MPNAVVRSVARKTGLDVEAVERYYLKAKAAAVKAGRPYDMAFIVGMLSRMTSHRGSRNK